MKVLIIHTYYQQKGGEDAVFEQECALLKQKHEVETLVFRNEGGVKGLLQFIISIWNIRAAARLKKKINTFKPDIIHIHNWHFGSGPLIVRTASNKGVPVVLTLHNYRLLCPSATLLSEGKIFISSLSESFPWSAIRKKVYRNSLILTFWLAFVVWIHKKAGTWRRVNKYVALTDFAASLFESTLPGIKPDQLVVKPNFAGRNKVADEVRCEHFLFVGRFSEEKGIDILLNAFSRLDYTVHIAGDGPLKEDILMAAGQNKNIKYLGGLSKEQVLLEMRKASALIFPSIWYEGMPMTMIEALSTGTPIIASELGAMKSIITHEHNGLLFSPEGSSDLIHKLNSWVSYPAEVKARFSEQALNTYNQTYTPDKGLMFLENIYSHSI